MAKKGFTLMEIVIGMVLIGVGLTAIMGVLQYATKLNNTTKAQIIATNLAREGVETMFQIRDTNWKMFSSKKDKCRLAVAPVGNSTTCETIPWIAKTTGAPTDTYFSLGADYIGIPYGSEYTGEYVLRNRGEGVNGLHVKDNNKETAPDQLYRMCFRDMLWKPCSDFQNLYGTFDNNRFQTRYGKYRRSIIIKGLFAKDNTVGGTELACPDGNTGACGDSSPKELRFCSRVDYIFEGVRRVELCSVMTNFEE